jgi:16S rRNA processing protein RimM
MSSFKKVGKIKDYHGLKGDLTVLIFSKDISWLKSLRSFKLGKEESPELTFEVEGAKAFKEGLLVKPVGLKDRTAGEKLKLKGMNFFIPEELLVSEEGEDIYLSEIEGFEVFQNDKKIGEINGFLSSSFQDLMQIKMTDGKIGEVPFVDAFIKHIDFPNKRVLVELPEGLLEINP